MNDSRYAGRVGVFVAVGLVLIALLILNFSKGVTLFHGTYTVHLVMPTVAGIKPSADVMMAGVPIGKVSGTELEADGRSVNITIGIASKFRIRKDAIFSIDSMGFLGDQYVEVSPPPLAEAGTNNPGFLQNGDTVHGKEPFNMLAAFQSTSELLDEAHKAMKDIDQAVTNVNRTVLSDQTLKSFGEAISNLSSVTSIGIQTVQEADDLIHSNTQPITSAVSNLQAVSEKINVIADKLDGVVTTNSGDIRESVKNLRDTTASFKQIAAGLEAGNGLAGSLLKDQEMKAEAAALISNANSVASEFSAFGSNLNQQGIWRMLWKPKHTERSEAPAH
jgi:phospholipid/cholesterol/gamma-HCH transport system substrate-binding protein